MMWPEPSLSKMWNRWGKRFRLCWSMWAPDLRHCLTFGGHAQSSGWLWPKLVLIMISSTVKPLCPLQLWLWKWTCETVHPSEPSQATNCHVGEMPFLARPYRRYCVWETNPHWIAVRGGWRLWPFRFLNWHDFVFTRLWKFCPDRFAHRWLTGDSVFIILFVDERRLMRKVSKIWELEIQVLGVSVSLCAWCFWTRPLFRPRSSWCLFFPEIVTQRWGISWSNFYSEPFFHQPCVQFFIFFASMLHDCFCAGRNRLRALRRSSGFWWTVRAWNLQGQGLLISRTASFIGSYRSWCWLQSRMLTSFSDVLVPPVHEVSYIFPWACTVEYVYMYDVFVKVYVYVHVNVWKCKCLRCVFIHMQRYMHVFMSWCI